MLVASRYLRDVLQAKGYPVQLQEINGGHDFFNWQAGLADGLTSLLNTKEGEMKRGNSYWQLFFWCQPVRSYMHSNLLGKS